MHIQKQPAKFEARILCSIRLKNLGLYAAGVLKSGPPGLSLPWLTDMYLHCLPNMKGVSVGRCHPIQAESRTRGMPDDLAQAAWRTASLIV